MNETVLAARDFLHSPAGEKEYKKLRTGPEVKRQGDAPVVAAFLGWKIQRVEEALAEIADIEDEVVSHD